MKVKNFRKDLRNAENTITGVAAAIDAYEEGYITFNECLQLITEAHAQEIKKP